MNSVPRTINTPAVPIPVDKVDHGDDDDDREEYKQDEQRAQDDKYTCGGTSVETSKGLFKNALHVLVVSCKADVVSV